MDTWFRSEIYSADNAPLGVPAYGRGPIVVRQSTNDNNDDGYDDGDVEIWYLRFADIDAAIRSTGVTHVGFYGQPVEVFLDGERLTAANRATLVGGRA